MLLLRLAIRNVFRHRTRSLITLAAIVFGCVCLIFVGGYFDDTYHKMSETYIRGQTGHLQVLRKGFIQYGRKEPFKYLIPEAQILAREISKIPGIKVVSARLQFNGLITAGDTTVPCIVQGVEPLPIFSAKQIDLENKYEVGRRLVDMGSIIISGEPLEDDAPYGMTFGEGLANGLGIHPGDNVVLLTNTVFGSLNALDFNVQGIFNTGAKVFDDRFIRIPLLTAQSLVDTNGVQSLVVLLDRTSETEKVRIQVTKFLASKDGDLEIKTWRELNDFFTKTEKLFERIFFILKLVVAIIVILSIYNTMNMSVLERITEIGTIMALGTKRKRVLGLILLEGTFLGLIGGISGVMAGMLCTWGIGHIGIPMPPPAGATMWWISEPTVVFSSVLFAFSLAVITAVISSILPGLHASKFEIAEALRRAN